MTALKGFMQSHLDTWQGLGTDQGSGEECNIPDETISLDMTKRWKREYREASC